jgi:hypothetical protein
MSSTGSVGETAITSESDKVYSIDGGKQFSITAVPKPNNFNTTYAFEYWNDGTKNADAPIFAAL